MKTKFLIILALIVCQLTFAGTRNNSPKGADGPAREQWSLPLLMLAPATPVEATFDETVDSNPGTLSMSAVAPVTPREATFEDLPAGNAVSSTVSAPANQKPNATDKGKAGHNAFPPPCSVKYGCSL
jgi:hypothetical protein